MPLWTSNGSGSWLTANRWSGNSIPNGVGAVAEFTVNTEVFGIYQISIPSNTTITIGTLNIVSSSLDGYSILSASGATDAFLRFQGIGGGPAFINVDSNGSEENNIRGTSGMGVVFASDVILTTINSDTYFEITAPISGSGDLNKYGTGTLRLAADNSGWLGDVNLLGGRTLANGTALGTGNVELNNGAVLVSAFTVANRIEVGATSAIGTIATGAGQVLTLSGQLVMASNSANAVRFGETGVVGTVILTGTSTILGTGGFAIVDGIVQFGNAGVAANYFSNLSTLATFSVIGIVETRGFATAIDNLDMDGGVLRAGTGALDVTVTDTTNGGNSQTGTIEGSAGVDRILINAATNFSLSAANFVNWSAADSITINGNAAANNLTGSSQNDMINGGAGADMLAGRLGNDWFYVDNAGDLVVELAGEGSDRVFASVSYALGAGQSVEMFTTDRNTGTSAINLTGNELANTIYGNDGANILDGKSGADVLVGRLGNDWFYVDNAADYVLELAGEGSDRVFASVSYALGAGQSVELFTTDWNAGTSAINLTGNELANTIYGNDGANILDGKSGADVLVGRLGNDWFHVDNAADYVLELAGEGSDRVFASTSYTLGAGASVETFTTSSNTGTTAINLTGNELTNDMYGNDGANVLDGKGGVDYLTGRAGADTFAFTTALGAGNVDVISDFSAVDDTIALDDAIFPAVGPPGALNANAFVIGSGAADASDRIIYNNTTGALLFDADGTGGIAAVQFATLAPGLALTASDFMVI